MSNLQLRLHTLLSSGKKEDQTEAQRIQQHYDQLQFKQQQIRKEIERLQFEEQHKRRIDEEDYQQHLLDVYTARESERHQMKGKDKELQPYVEIFADDDDNDTLHTAEPSLIGDEDYLQGTKQRQPTKTTTETQTENIIQEIKRIHPTLNKEEVKRLIKANPELKDAIMSAYINQFLKKGNVTNFNDINEVFNTNMRHTPKTYFTPTAEKIKKSKQPKNYDYMFLVPSTFKKVF